LRVGGTKVPHSRGEARCSSINNASIVRQDFSPFAVFGLRPLARCYEHWGVFGKHLPWGPGDQVSNFPVFVWPGSRPPIPAIDALAICVMRLAAPRKTVSACTGYGGPRVARQRPPHSPDSVFYPSIYVMSDWVRFVLACFITLPVCVDV
jgi:hypothetical protein